MTVRVTVKLAALAPPSSAASLSHLAVASTSSPSPSSPQSATRTAIAIASGYCAAWGLYYLVQDMLRRTAVRKRRKRHHCKVPGANRIDDQQSEPPVAYVAGVASTKVSPNSLEKIAIEERFASMSLLGRYVNPFAEWREQGAWEFAVWKTIFFFSKARLWSDGGIAKDRTTEEGRKRIAERLTLARPDWTKHGPIAIQANEEAESWDVVSESDIAPSKPSAKKHDDSALRFTWIGQSTFVITTQSINILTDPVFGVQPIPSIFSPNRLNRTLPATLQEIVAKVNLDVILVTHNHFDHFDTAVVHLIPQTATWVVPMGMRSLLEKSGARSDRIVELDWWQERVLTFSTQAAGSAAVATATSKARFNSSRQRQQNKRLNVRAFPALHWSARTGIDTNQSLWCSYSLQTSFNVASAEAKVYFSGDTGYSASLTRAIGYHSGPFDLAFLPIGSYEPRWHMRPQHVSAQDSVLIARNIGARRAVAMHWATWVMSDEPWEAPALELEQTVARVPPAVGYDVNNRKPWFDTMSLGETRLEPIAANSSH